VTVALAVAAVGSVSVALIATWLVAANARRLGLIDVPNARSSHTVSTARGGGLGVAAGVIAGILLLAAFGDGPTRQLAILLAGAGVIAALGAFDDVHPIRAGVRLLGQLLVAVAVVVGLGGVARLPLPPPLDLPVGWLAAPLGVLWLVSITNFYNFMDGIDGLAAGQTAASCIGVAIAGWASGAIDFAVVLAAAAVGFLVLNRPPARIFLGDVGSTSLGFALAGMPLLAPMGERHMAVFAVAVGLSLFLLDPVETLVRLARAGHRVGKAHRLHSYQLLAPTRGRHAAVAGALVSGGLVLSMAGGLAYRVPLASWPVAALGLCAFAVERYLAVNRPRRRPEG
jgi:glycosyltransferase WbpL